MVIGPQGPEMGKKGLYNDVKSSYNVVTAQKGALNVKRT